MVWYHYLYGTPTMVPNRKGTLSSVLYRSSNTASALSDTAPGTVRCQLVMVAGECFFLLLLLLFLHIIMAMRLLAQPLSKKMRSRPNRRGRRQNDIPYN